MKDGIYDFHFSALNRTHAGSLTMLGNIGEGGDARHLVRGQISLAGTNIIASFEVKPRVSTDGQDRGDPAGAYTLKMFGTGTESDFSVLGIAPLGLIVELRGAWMAELPR